ncbi:MAG: aldehyde ferredoxin oxidoreductase N-terminal domain-containing protein [Promethearchaeati archaeon]
MNKNGYTGNILNIDLATGTILVEKESTEDITHYIGGIGMNCRLGAELITPEIRPLSSDNIIIIGTGPLVGTIMPGASRTVVLSKFPATGAIANSCGSMSFGFYMKQAGYDHIIIRNRANSPSYLYIKDDKIQIKNAGELWGKDIVETTNILKKQYGESGVIAIGQAGENLVVSALTLIDKTSTLGRGGLGAIMGSKNLKAILVQGTKGIEVARPKTFMNLYHQLYNRIENYPHRESWHQLGMLRSLPINMILAAKGQKKKARQCNERTYLNKIKYRRLACPSCPMGDKDLLELQEGKFSGLTNYTSSVINPFLMLTLDGLETYGQAIKAFDMTNRYGLDSLTITSLLDFLARMNEDGILIEDETGVDWKRDYNSLIRLIEIIAYREGFGDILAEGWIKLSEKYPNIDKKMLVIKGLDVIFEPRFLRMGTMEFEQVVNPKGAHVASGGSPTYVGAGHTKEKFIRHFERMGIPKTSFQRLFNPPKPEMGVDIGRLTRYSEDWYTILTCLGLCARAQMNRFYSFETVVSFYNAATGLDITPEELRKAAERTWNLLRIMNAKEGFTREDDNFPKEWFNPLKYGDHKLEFKNFQGDVKITQKIAETLLEHYYAERGWDPQTGHPSKEKIKELKLEKFL